MEDSATAVACGVFTRTSAVGSAVGIERDFVCALEGLSVAGVATRFPKWRSVYTVFRRWRLDGTWERIHAELRMRTRKAVGKKPTPTAIMIDSQTSSTMLNGEQRGYDAGKKRMGRKRHLGVDTLGWVWAVVVHAASIQDQDGAPSVLRKLHAVCRRLKVIFADAAYGRNGLPKWTQQTFGWVLQTVLRPVGIKGFVVQPKRWIVERTFAWLSASRRLRGCLKTVRFGEFSCHEGDHGDVDEGLAGFIVRS
jgi:putative transposase